MSTAKTLFLIALTTLAGAILSEAVSFDVIVNCTDGTPGCDVFNQLIGIKYSNVTLADATTFTWSIFNQSTPASRKNFSSVSLFIEDAFDDVYTRDNEIHVSAPYLGGYYEIHEAEADAVKTEFTGLVYHHTTHVWQWDANWLAPWGLYEGIADYVRLKAGYPGPDWVAPGEGDRWDQGHDVTAHFLDYLSSRKNGFVADLNELMKNGYSDDFFEELLGETVHQLWCDYKAKYDGDC